MGMYSLSQPMILDETFIDEAKKIHLTPTLLTNLDHITKTYNRLKSAFNQAIICFSIKSHNDSSLISHLYSIGSSFDVASWAEISKAHSVGVPATKMVYSTPVKKISEIKKAYQLGVRKFTFDSFEEVNKIAKVAPQAELILRIMVESDGSQCPMFKKFGVYIDEALEHLQYAISKKLSPIGLTFHVGSQCLRASNWQEALRRANVVWNEARQHGIPLNLLNLGGGLPVSYDKPIISIEKIVDLIKKEIKKDFIGLKEIYIEPGRYMTDNSSVMLTTVIGKATRGSVEWIFLDVGGFHGLFEIFEGFLYEIKAPYAHNRPLREYAVAGPTCDGMDIIRENIKMPEIKIGERVFVMNAGAYSISKRQYNGMRWARPHAFTNQPVEKQ